MATLAQMQIKELLPDTITECPKCGADWDSLQADLETEPIGSRALDQALTIIMNCDVCRLKFKPQIETCRRVYTARRLGKEGG